jgi:hypothetical protein
MWGKVSLVDFLHLFHSRIFYHQSFAAIGLQKQLVPQVGWTKKFLCANYCDFLPLTGRCNRKSSH